MFVGKTVRSSRDTIEVAVLIGGVEQALYRRLVDGRVFVVGTPGQSYTLRVRNLTKGRIEVINTVDGRHTLDDEPGDAHANRGLVFRANSAGEFSGWRISDQQTREFVFGSPEHSIAARATGSTSNVGIIGFAVHVEQRSFDYGSTFRGGGLESFGGTPKGGPVTRGATRGGSLGTGMGAIQEDSVGRTSFTRSHIDPDVLVIGYETEDVLREQGIFASAGPNAFPGVTTGYEKYCR